MRVTSQWSSGGGNERLDLADLETVRRAGILDVAAELLRQTADVPAGEPFSRRALLLRFVGHLPRASRDALTQLLAEGWQVLEHVGFVCAAPLENGDAWFVTRRGEAKRDSPALRDELHLARVT